MLYSPLILGPFEYYDESKWVKMMCCIQMNSVEPIIQVFLKEISLLELIKKKL